MICPRGLADTNQDALQVLRAWGTMLQRPGSSEGEDRQAIQRAQPQHLAVPGTSRQSVTCCAIQQRGGQVIQGADGEAILLGGNV